MSTDGRGIIAVLVFACALSGLGCTEPVRARIQEQNQRFLKREAERGLKERADEYWDFARWYSWQETARFYERDDAQRVHLNAGTARDPATLAKIDAVEIQYVYVDTETRKTGEVRVRWREIPERSTAVVERSIAQRWYRRGGQWWLAPDEGIPDDPHDELGDAERALRAGAEDAPDLETVVPAGP